MTKELTLDVVARKNSKELSQLADEFDRLSKTVDDSGKSMQKHATFSRFLDDELKKTKQTVKELGLEFEATGDKDVFAKLKGAEANVKKLEGLGKQLKSSVVADMEQAGEEAGQGFVGMLIKAWPVVLPIAAALGTEIVAAVGGGILGVAGGGALATGIALQLKNPTVHAAVTELGSFVKGELTSATDVFQGPLLAGLDELKQGLDLGSLRGAFKEIAPYTELFGRELGHAAQVFLPMFTHALKDGAPILGIIAHELPTLAKGLGDFFEQIGHGAKGGGEALDTFIKAISFGLSGLGYIIRTAENAWDDFIQVVDKGSGIAAKLLGWVPGLGDAIKGLHGYADGVATSFDDGKISASGFADAVAGNNDSVVAAMAEATKAAQDLSDAMDKLIGKYMTGDEAALKQTQSVADLFTAIKKNGNEWDTATEAGRKNTEALYQAIQAAEAKRIADVANGKDAVLAAEDYNTQVDALLGIAGRAGDAKDKLDALKGKYEVDVQTVYLNKFISEGTPPSEFRHGLADGGPVTAGKPYIVGEEGPEMFVSSNNGYIVPADQTAALMGVGGGTGGTGVGGVQRVQIDLTLNGETVRSLLVNLGRRSGFRTVDQLLPVGSAR